MGGGGGGWVAGLSKTKTKPNTKLKFELKFGAELCKKITNTETERVSWCLRNVLLSKILSMV